MRCCPLTLVRWSIRSWPRSKRPDQKLQIIDTESLNDLLREALKVALDVIIQIDFTVTISTPLKDQFATGESAAPAGH